MTTYNVHQGENTNKLVHKIAKQKLFFTVVRSTWNQLYPHPKISNWISSQNWKLDFYKYYTELVLKSFFKKTEP